VSDVLWEPSAERIASSALARYAASVGADPLDLEAYGQLWEWSVRDLDDFWVSLWRHFEISGDVPTRALDPAHADMPGARWFPEVRLNYAARALATTGDAVAVVSRSQSRAPVDLTWDELRAAVASARAGLQARGVERGDRVAAYLPNIAETLVAFLATASLGAVWSSCAPEFGPRAVIERFGQIEPAVLLTVDGYRYGERIVDRRDEVAQIRAALPSLRSVVTVPYLDPDAMLPASVAWGEAMVDVPGGELEFEPVPFDHPLYVLYSSGTTGPPKAIVHGHGGITVEHCKALALHSDLGPGDRFLWFSTTGWMMWNFLVSGLLVGATVVCFDGDPVYPDPDALWSMAAETGVTFFGTSAPYVMACRRGGLRVGERFDLGSLRSVGSTGAPLPADGFRWVYDAVSRDVQVASVSGGTDVCTAFVGSSPVHPVRAGVIACRYLGAAVSSYAADGRPLVGSVGELVVTRPMPSMPVGLWGDGDGSRYRATYFSRFDGVWHHGDWISIEADGSCEITGRSDATLNRGGVRLGTAEFYAVVEAMPEVADSLVVHLEDDAGGPGTLALFVVAAAGAVVDDDLVGRIKDSLRRNLSPRHVPDVVLEVPAVPRTLSGKKLEVPVKRVLQGAAPHEVASPDALVDPGALDAFASLAPQVSRASRP
jgi:acetoacetyl-CoA synthetase